MSDAIIFGMLCGAVSRTLLDRAKQQRLVKPGLLAGPHVRFRRVQTSVREEVCRSSLELIPHPPIGRVSGVLDLQPVVFASSLKPEPHRSPLVRYFEGAATLATFSHLAMRALA
jgi:hypothetical protein